MTGREIWFVRSRDGGGTYSPVTPQGRRAFRLALLWIIGCGTLFPMLFAWTLQPVWIVAMFVVGGAGLPRFARTVIRHSDRR